MCIWVSYSEILSQAEANHRSVEMSLRNVAEKRDELDADKKSLERSFEEVKGQVAEEVMNRKLLEQRSESQKSHLENTKKKKVDFLIINNIVNK